jgi:HAMP domain-containing protein
MEATLNARTQALKNLRKYFKKLGPTGDMTEQTLDEIEKCINAGATLDDVILTASEACQ